ncbi:A-kinase anchor mitochondrial-like isoform X1 [Labeo rohita]|uniref:A-kinase anchor mitochondrial-like isoform X1 n=1 Tax=Labeo rohita TaxID=84645 RepID=A0A498M7L4_LABRO|nr:A-kinase anchor mitochondrial-like isoform X1 [Labeo rohita]
METAKISLDYTMICGISGKRMLLSFRPLISVSVLTLLGWCWYSFRRRRRTTTAPLWTKENMSCSDKSSPLQSSPADSSILEESDLNMDHSISGSSEIKNLTSTSSKIGLTKGIRPEPEGEVSVRFPDTLRTEQEKDNIAGDGHPYCGEVIEEDSGLESDPICLSSNRLSTDSHTLTEQQSGPVRLDSHDGSSLSDLSPERSQESMEKISSVQVQQVIDAAINQEPSDPHELASVSRSPKGGFQHAAQESFSSDDDNRVSHAGSFRDKLLSHLGDDSGCGSCFSEDACGADGLTRELSEEAQGFLMTPTEADTVSTESKMTSSVLGVAEGEELALRGA